MTAPTLKAPSLKPLPPEEALAYFRKKGAKFAPTFDWREMWQEAHATAFTVAKSAGFDILKDIHSALEGALADGKTFHQFAEELIPVLQAKGWWGKAYVTDPLTGEPTQVQLGSVRRLRTIFDVNLRMAYAAGRWAQIQRTQDRRPYLRYVAILDDRVRPDHRAWHGTVLKIDDAWWDSHYPPNGWRCRCTVQQLSARDLVRFGYSVTATPPPSPIRRWVNKRTGEVVKVPQGIDPGFAYHPGKASLLQQAEAILAEKLESAPPILKAALEANGVRMSKKGKE